MKTEILFFPHQGLNGYRVAVQWSEIGSPLRTVASEIIKDNAHPLDVAAALYKLALEVEKFARP